MKKKVVNLLLWILNGRLLNNSPCRYGFIGNVDAFDRSYLESEERQRPGITVAQIIAESKQFESCPLDIGLAVIENGEIREGTVWDVHELRQMFERKTEHEHLSTDKCVKPD
jgi:hypothetical protein